MGRHAGSTVIAGVLLILVGASCSNDQPRGAAGTTPPAPTSVATSMPPTSATSTVEASTTTTAIGPTTSAPDDDLPPLAEATADVEALLEPTVSIDWDPGLRTNCGPTDALLPGWALLGSGRTEVTDAELEALLQRLEAAGLSVHDRAGDWITAVGPTWQAAMRFPDPTVGSDARHLEVNLTVQVAEAPIPDGFAPVPSGCG